MLATGHSYHCGLLFPSSFAHLLLDVLLVHARVLLAGNLRGLLGALRLLRRELEARRRHAELLPVELKLAALLVKEVLEVLHSASAARLSRLANNHVHFKARRLRRFHSGFNYI